MSTYAKIRLDDKPIRRQKMRHTLRIFYNCVVATEFQHIYIYIYIYILELYSYRQAAVIFPKHSTTVKRSVSEIIADAFSPSYMMFAGLL